MRLHRYLLPLLSLSVHQGANSFPRHSVLRRAEKKDSDGGSKSDESGSGSDGDNKQSQRYRRNQSRSQSQIDNVVLSLDPPEKEVSSCIGQLCDDMAIRFNKVSYDPSLNIPPNVQFRVLTSHDYPLSGDVVYWLRQSQCPSVIIEEDCYECDVPFDTLIDKIGGPPSHPSTNPSSPFWQEFREVVEVQKHRLAGSHPTEVMPLAETWKNLNIDEVAEAVHNEYPGLHHQDLIAYLLRQGAEVDETIIPFLCETEFLREIVMMADLNTWSIGTVGPANFGLKYYAGRARPEEVAWMIDQDVITEDDGVPKDIVSSIKDFDLTSPESFTAYPEGSPRHPAWPAMHSAASSGSLWLPVVLNLSESQLCQAKLVDYDIAYARTVAGVHYPGDNIAGLDLGQEILAEKLPEHLATRYGSDPDVVREKIASLRFKWSQFTSSDCYLSGLAQ